MPLEGWIRDSATAGGARGGFPSHHPSSASDWRAFQELFELTPEADSEIRKVEWHREREHAAASYLLPTPHGSRPGIFYVNAYDLSSRPIWLAEALFLEANPRRHLQIVLQQEQEDLPAFRRHVVVTAFVEG